MSQRLDGQHVLVTGGARGIGEAIVEKALREGARVSFLDVEAAAAAALIARLDAGARLLFHRADIRRADEILELMCKQKQGIIDEFVKTVLLPISETNVTSCA